MFIGDGAKLVRDAFALAKEKAPAIIFIDELDAIGEQFVLRCAQGHITRTIFFILTANYYITVLVSYMIVHCSIYLCVNFIVTVSKISVAEPKMSYL